MPPILRTLSFGACALAVAATLDAVPAMADLRCDIASFAGRPAPAPASPGKDTHFRIFWQISTLIEELADAAGKPDTLAQIKEAAALSDGYYVNVLLAGPMTYWPGRPEQCGLNFKRIGENDAIEVDGETYRFEGGEAGKDDCNRLQEEFIASQGGKSEREIQTEALKRVFANLDLRGEQQRGKAIWGETLIGNTEFAYDEKADKATMTELPRTYCVLMDSGLTPNGMMLYQEPSLQVKRDKYLWIPKRNNKGKLVTSKPHLDAIPENSHAFAVLAEAIAAAGIPTGELRGNIRRWRDPRTPRAAAELAAIPQFGGYNFEGGTRMLADPRKTVDNLVEGASWLLANTDRDVSLLMPGYWDRDQVGSEEEIDTLPGRLRELVLAINRKLSAKMGLPDGQNAICTNRLVLIVGSYGRPIRVKPLPIRRGDGRLAGTVTGQLKMLADVRAELCGS